MSQVLDIVSIKLDSICQLVLLYGRMRVNPSIFLNFNILC